MLWGRAMTRRLIARAALRIGRWTIVGEPPADERVIVLAVPHTSNWDGFWMLCMASVKGMPVAWMGKRSLFRGVGGWFLRRLGGVPVDREAPGGQVAQMVAELNARDRMTLVVPPEGTRTRRDTWRSGFYHIARGADVPVALSFLDYGKRRGGFGPTLRLTGDVKADMDRIRAFYEDVTGRYPEHQSPIRLAEEDDDAPAS